MENTGRPVSRADDGNRQGGNEMPLPNRRKFLRQIGMAGAASAAFVGMADLAGIGSARAAVQPSKAQAAKARAAAKQAKQARQGKQVRALAQPAIDCSYGYGWAFCSPGNCGKACPSGSWCNWTFSVAPECGGNSAFRCIQGGCDYNSHSVVVCCASID